MASVKALDKCDRGARPSTISDILEDLKMWRQTNRQKLNFKETRMTRIAEDAMRSGREERPKRWNGHRG